MFGVDDGAGRLGSARPGGIPSATLGATGGEQNHTQTTDEVGPHSHGVDVGGVAATGVNVRSVSGDGTAPGVFNTHDVSQSSHAAMNNLPPAAVVYWYIKK
jgi:microcystin-dependent protein